MKNKSFLDEKHLYLGLRLTLRVQQSTFLELVLLAFYLPHQLDFCNNIRLKGVNLGTPA